MNAPPAPVALVRVFCIGAALLSVSVILNTCVLCTVVNIFIFWNVEQMDGSVESTFIFFALLLINYDRNPCINCARFVTFKAITTKIAVL